MTKEIVVSLYRPFYNFFPSFKLGEIPFNLIIFALILLVSGILFHILRSQYSQKHITFMNTMIGISFILFGLISFGQTWIQADELSSDYRKINIKTTSKTYEFFFPDIYPFIEKCNKAIKSDFNEGTIVTNFDSQELRLYILKYFLYPKVDLIKKEKSNPRYLIVFRTGSAENFVPDNYKIIVQEGSFKILAIKTSEHDNGI